MKLLSIDDSRAVHAFLDICLQGEPYETTHSMNGEDGIKILESGQTFDLVLLDWEMPGLTGPDVVTKLSEKGIRVPIIMLTSKNNIEDITRMLTLGVKEYVMKPFTKDILLEKIKSVI